MNPEVTVPVKSAVLSKINWGELLKILAMLGTATGLFTLSIETQNHILMLIIGAGGLYTMAMRTWFTNSITPSSLK